MKLANWIEIARVGRFRDSSGNWHDFSQGRLESIAAAYDPKKREAPLVFGHPATNGPAHGWIKGLKIFGQKLLALPACVSDAARVAVDNGRYRYVSMSLYQDGGLRHVGLLGANPPAIDGLAPVSFGDEEAAIVIDFSEAENAELNEPQAKGNQMTIEELAKQLGEVQAKLAAATGERDEALKKVTTLQEELDKLKGEGEKTAEIQEELDELKKEKEKTDAEFSAYRDRREVSTLVARVSQLVKDGKVSPAEKKAVAKTAVALHQAKKTGGANFADGAENPLEVYLKSLEGRPSAGIFQNFSAPAENDKNPAAHKPLSAKL